MQPGRQLVNHEAVEARVLSTLGPKFKQGNYKLHFTHEYGENYRLNALWQPPEHKVPLGIGSLSFDARTGETHVSVHPDHQASKGSAVTPVLLAAGNKISRLLGGVGLQGVRSTTEDSFKLIKRFFPADSTKITHRNPQPSIGDNSTEFYTRYEGNASLTRTRNQAGIKNHLDDSIIHSCFSCGGNGSDRRWLLDHEWSKENEHRRSANQGMIPADCPSCKGSGLEMQGRTPERFIGLS